LKRWIPPIVLLLLAWLGWAALTLPPESVALRLPAPKPGDPHVVRGAYHVHSRASDGTGTIPEIAAAAGRAGLRFVIVTDHGDGFRPPAPPRYLGTVLCIEGAEISTTDGHYAVLGMPHPPYPLAGEARDVVEDVARLGGFGVATHPDSAKRELRWDAWETEFDAIEWFNADSQWRDEPRWLLLPTLLHYPARPVEAVVSLFDRPAALLDRWDRLTRQRRVVGLAAADAHARMGLGGKTDPYDERLFVRVPSYESVFRAFSLRVELSQALSGDPLVDAGLVLGAIKAGHVHAAFDGVAGPAALSFIAESGGITAREGDTLALNGRVRIRATANTPPGGSLVLIRNGEVVHTSPGTALEWEDGRPGAYRIEAHAAAAPGAPQLPWIVSNPVYVGMAAAVARGGTPPSASSRLVLPAGSWHIEKDATSTGSFDVTEGQGGVHRRFVFQLGHGGGSPFVALVTPEVGPLHDAARLVFRAGASRPLRLSVQVRIIDGGAQLRWLRSVYLDPSARDLTVTFADMRVAGTAERRPFDPARIESLLLVFDTTNARPGDGGAVWVEGLRTER
jgi:hypothetical protein